MSKNMLLDTDKIPTDRLCILDGLTTEYDPLTSYTVLMYDSLIEKVYKTPDSYCEVEKIPVFTKALNFPTQESVRDYLTKKKYKYNKSVGVWSKKKLNKTKYVYVLKTKNVGYDEPK